MVLKELRGVEPQIPADFEEVLTQLYDTPNTPPNISSFLEIKEMIKILLHHNPADRLSAEELLKKYQHKAFV